MDADCRILSYVDIKFKNIVPYTMCVYRNIYFI